MLIKEQPEKLRAERVRKLGVWRKLKDTPKWRLNKSKAQHIRRDRVRNSEITLTSEDILFLIDFQENKCACCKKDFSESLKYELDHINPVSKGGGLTLDNIQLLCKSCNCSKGDKMINYRNEISFIKGGLNG
jgi:5-methylcytosine-specific restriction endonuclease McrA